MRTFCDVFTLKIEDSKYSALRDLCERINNTAKYSNADIVNITFYNELYAVVTFKTHDNLIEEYNNND